MKRSGVWGGSCVYNHKNDNNLDVNEIITRNLIYKKRDDKTI